MKSMTLGDVTFLVSYHAQAPEMPPADERFAVLAKMPYQEYLKSPEWKHISARMRDTYRYCGDCGLREFRLLQVHHLSYERRGGREQDHDLIVLCASCHRERHGIAA